jgi:hypothetical protein
VNAGGKVEAVANDLYALPVSEFTAERDAQAAAARTGGDPDLAVAIKKLRRPTASAALVNLLVRERASEIEALLGVGARLRGAQESLAVADLRELSQQRRATISELVQDAKALAARRGESASQAMLSDVRTTLDAATADETAAADLRAGRLTKALQYTGFGSELTVSAPTRPSSSEKRRTAKPTGGQVTALDPRRALRDAEAAAEHARDDFLAAERDLSAARLRTEDVRRDVLSLEEQLLSVREQLATTKREQTTAERAHKSAQQALDRAEKARDKAQQATDSPGS